MRQWEATKSTVCDMMSNDSHGCGKVGKVSKSPTALSLSKASGVNAHHLKHFRTPSSLGLLAVSPFFLFQLFIWLLTVTFRLDFGLFKVIQQLPLVVLNVCFPLLRMCMGGNGLGIVPTNGSFQLSAHIPKPPKKRNF